MISINSLSGGKTSSYMAIHYPADVNLFAVVLAEGKECAPKDKGLLREAQSRIPHFEGSKEVDATLLVMLKLEQDLQREIKWIASTYTFDSLLNKAKMLPNFRTRFCTSELKMRPIFEYCYNFLPWPSYMQIGFRADEKRRASKMLQDCDRAYFFKFPYKCNVGNKQQRHKKVEWRVPAFPLIDDNIDHLDIIKYWHSRPEFVFPRVSNCDFCFFHKVADQRLQLEEYPERITPWIEQERRVGRSFAKGHYLSELLDSSAVVADIPSFNPCNCTD